jgi:hypothetical protein
MHARRHYRGQRNAEPTQVKRLVRVIADRGDPRDPERLQSLGGNEMAALGLAAPPREVRLVGIEPRVL